MNNDSKKGLLIVVSGFSGTGKGTVVNELIDNYQYFLSVSATTRAPRGYEKHGKEYFFLSKEEFNNMIEHNGLIEWAEYCNNYYGTPKTYVEEKISQGENVILEIEMKGAKLIKKQYPKAVLIFIAPPSIIELQNRLLGRGTEDEDTIKLRLHWALEEAEVISDYDYIVINDNLENCVQDIHSIITAEYNKTYRNKQLIKSLKEELEKMTKGED